MLRASLFCQGLESELFLNLQTMFPAFSTFHPVPCGDVFLLSIGRDVSFAVKVTNSRIMVPYVCLFVFNENCVSLMLECVHAKPDQPL